METKESKGYNFEEVKSFLKERNLWKWQAFSCPSVWDTTEEIYFKDGVSISVSYEYTYIDVIGLSTNDFNKLGVN